jgi:hypothetical protein
MGELKYKDPKNKKQIVPRCHLQPSWMLGWYRSHGRMHVVQSALMIKPGIGIQTAETFMRTSSIHEKAVCRPSWSAKLCTMGDLKNIKNKNRATKKRYVNCKYKITKALT